MVSFPQPARLGALRCVSAAGLLLAAVSCQKDADPAAPAGGATASADRTAAFKWISGTLPSGGAPAQLVVPNAQLNFLNVRKSGVPIYKSNNPEVFTGSGWLMQNARRAAGRGGRAFHLAGKNVIYLFHINKSGSAKYLHVLASNPSATANNVTYRGACCTNSTHPLTGAATGQSYQVARSWLTGSLPVAGSTGSFAQSQVREIFKTRMASLNMVDGRFEVTSAQPTIYYVVVTNNGTLTEAITASQGTFAPGAFFPEVPDDFAREAGVYATSEVSAENTVDLPAGPAYIGFCVNTTNKFFPVENQSSDSLMVMKRAAPKTYGNYGHFYRLKFNLNNATGATKRVRLYFASNATDPARTEASWNGPIRSNGALFDVYTTFNKPRVQLSDWTVNPGVFEHTVEFYVPGLITTNQQLIYQVN